MSGYIFFVPDKSTQLKNGPSWPLFHLYSVFLKQTLYFLHQLNAKNVHQVYGAGIQTHDLQKINLLQ